MRAWRVHSLGDPAEVLSLDDVDRPVPGEGQLLVRVLAAGLNFPDVLMTRGEYQERPPLPFTPGVEVCGEVVGTGQRVLGAPAALPSWIAADPTPPAPACTSSHSPACSAARRCSPTQPVW